MRAIFTTWHGRFEQLTSGRFQGTVQVVLGSLVRIFSTEANQRMFFRGHDTGGLISFCPVTDSAADCIWQGRRYDQGQLAVKRSGAEVDLFSSRGVSALTLELKPEVLLDSIRAILSTKAALLAEGWTSYSIPPDAFRELTRQFDNFLQRALADPSLVGSAEGHRLEQECVRAVVASLFAGTSLPRAPLPVRLEFVRRTEELMRSRLGDPIGAIDLCREIGVNDRTLRLAFRERYGVGPMTYFRFLRLNAVRHRLRTDPQVAIADAARDCGFHHLGNFASDYRRLFGLLPSETVRGSA